MAQTQSNRPRITASDRLGFTLFLALTLHAIVVLGVGFTPTRSNNTDPLPTLDIILANSKTFETVDNPDFLAQEDQAGGGNAEDRARPSAPVSAPTPVDQRGLAERDQREMQRQPLALAKLYYVTQRESDTRVDSQKQKRAKDNNRKKANPVEQRESKIARLQAEIRQMTIDYARRPKTITLTASTRKAVEASYLASWVQKIEHTGNLNYPQEARVNKLDGRLRMSVRLNAEGEVLDMQITASSGTSVLDEAARRILRMAQPFAPFSEELRERADQIVIIRTWDFKSNRFKTQSGVS
ncbi:MAG: energy transducer TonB [Gammaproteobacteria bacterium]|nr:MAG: energy transducer TonB [Gammaproteobacteria bacterium]UCH41854.1 MAG: energy transducer TonB [Gammaproteobacteria bacterium]